jgi:hypothetical protein
MKRNSQNEIMNSLQAITLFRGIYRRVAKRLDVDPSYLRLSKKNSAEPWGRPGSTMVDLFRSLCKNLGFETLNVKVPTNIEGPLVDMYRRPGNKYPAINTPT